MSRNVRNVIESKDNPIRQRSSLFWTTVNFEFEYFFNEDTDGVLTDTLMNFQNWHLTWLSQLKSDAKLRQTF